MRQASGLAGLTTEALRRALPEKIPTPLYNVVISDLVTDNHLLRDGPLLRLPGHQVSLSAHETKLAERALALLETSGLKPPKFNELAVQLGAEPQPLRTLLKRLAQNGEIHLVSADYFFRARGYRRPRGEDRPSLEINARI